MSTIRRLYFYALSLISAEVVIWGVVSLLRTLVSGRIIGSGSLLATGLSLVLVGLPIFYLHWRTVQRDAAREVDERASRIRPVFFYAALFAVLIPMLYAVFALLDRSLTQLFGQPASRAWFGGDQSAWDNLIALAANAVALVYFGRLLRADWLADFPKTFLSDTRRLYRYLWVILSLILTVSGVSNLLLYLLYSPGQNAEQTIPLLAGSISLLLVGTPLWIYHWRTVQQSLVDAEERGSLLRLVVLYLISLVGVVGVLTLAGLVVASLLRWILGEANTLVVFLQSNSAQLGTVIPLAVMWAYYGGILNREVAAMPDQPRRAALRRLYYYILSFLGLAVTFAGLLNLVDFMAQVAFSTGMQIGSYNSLLSNALSALLVGMPLWLTAWRSMQREADRRDDAGDHARRSVVRKAYLYLVLFLTVIGTMTFTGQLFYELLNAAFSQAAGNLALKVTRLFLSLVIVVLFLIYHWLALREDGRLAQQSLGNQHAMFPTLVLLEGEGQFADELIHALARIAPRLPVAIHQAERGAPDESMLAAKVLLMPVSLALTPPDSLRLWLAEYTGRRILIPLPMEGGWTWLGLPEKRPAQLAREAANTIRHMAEGETVRQASPAGAWTIVGYILGSLFAIQLLFILFGLIVSLLSN